MANISLDYITSLSPINATEIADGDIMLVNHNGSDFSIRVAELMTLIRNKTYEPGTVHWFATAVDPNAKYVGQTWVRVPAPERTVRIAKDDNSDLLQTGGSDTVTIARSNLPASALSVTGTAQDTDLGTKQTSDAGGHDHNGGADGPGAQYGTKIFGSNNDSSHSLNKTSFVDNHQHTVAIGPHGHTVNGQTENLGSGQALSVKNAFVVLAAWYRVS